MRFFLISIIFLQFGITNAQSRATRTPSRVILPPIPEFKSKIAAGVFLYNEKKVVKKLKLSKKNKIIKNKVSQSIRNYNTRIDSIALNNSDYFKKLDLIVKTARKSNKNKVFNKPSSQIQEQLKPIRFEVTKIEKELNLTLKTLLSDKQYEKWLKHQKTKKKEKLLFPPKVIRVRRSLGTRVGPVNY